MAYGVGKAGVDRLAKDMAVGETWEVGGKLDNAAYLFVAA